jgi:hypothetical protein
MNLRQHPGFVEQKFLQRIEQLHFQIRQSMRLGDALIEHAGRFCLVCVEAVGFHSRRIGAQGIRISRRPQVRRQMGGF